MQQLTTLSSRKEIARSIFDGAMRELEFTSQEVDRILSTPYSRTMTEQIQTDTWVRIGKIFRIAWYLPALLGEDNIGGDRVRRWFRVPNQYLHGQSAIDALMANPDIFIDRLLGYVSSFVYGDFS